ncbi:hypothetical protein [Actinopolymorpha pittospori]|uniref:Uncharacterized protein n=1 Tax=Actinopolymorpha pittospori TaxID=648752 RepID=A0A927MWW0_9ACTN|nr:hypothetical protein [Actinopolymorpha pittospori]MBE1608094.1 hypothetical protein [Actinopolymorpha pittospori]
MSATQQQRDRRTWLRRAGIALSILVIAGLVLLVVFRTQYEVAVRRCEDGPSKEGRELTEARYGWQNSPPGYWCERGYDDGSTERVSFGFFP